MYHRHLCGLEDVWSQPASKFSWERTRTLLALSATCRLTRQVVLPEAWEVYSVCPLRFVPRLHGVLLSRCRLLLRDPHFVANVRLVVRPSGGGHIRRVVIYDFVNQFCASISCNEYAPFGF